MVEKRRRKKVRVQAESSSDDSDLSDNELAVKSDAELSELSDAEAPESPSSARNDVDPSPTSTPRERSHKAPHQSETEFNQMFLGLVTQQFGEELAALRESNDFGPASITQLVAGLKQGVDIFTNDQKKMLA